MMTMFLGVNASVCYINMVQDHDENIYIYNSYVFKHDIFPNGYAIRLGHLGHWTWVNVIAKTHRVNFRLKYKVFFFETFF